MPLPPFQLKPMDSVWMSCVVDLFGAYWFIDTGVTGRYIFATIGVLLSILSFVVLKCNYKARAWFGLAENIFGTALCYGAAYQKYVESGLNLRPYVVYSQLVGVCIIGLAIFGFVRTFKIGFEHPEITEKSIIWGYIAGLSLIVIIFGGLAILYFTIFDESISLVESSKMLYCALGMNVGIAYSLVKVYMFARDGKLMYQEEISKKKKKRKY